MSLEQILHHFRKEEQSFAERIVELAERVKVKHDPILTDFLDPRQVEIVKSIVNSYMELAVFFDGGYESAERVRALIVPDYIVYNPDEMGLSFLNITGDNRFESLTHKDYMGALLNIGLKREKFGDILLAEKSAQYVVGKEIADFVRLELKKIKNTKVVLEEIERSKLVTPIQNYQIVNLTVASQRVDIIIGHVYNQSRANVSQLVKANRLKVNWKPIDKPDYQIKTGDVISLKGFGRFKILEEEGNTKKGKLKLKIGKLL